MIVRDRLTHYRYRWQYRQSTGPGRSEAWAWDCAWKETYLSPTDRALDALHHFLTLFFKVVSETLAGVTRLLGAWWLRVVPQDQPWIELTPIHYHTTFYSLLVPYYMDRGLTWRVA